VEVLQRHVGGDDRLALVGELRVLWEDVLGRMDESAHDGLQGGAEGLLIGLLRMEVVQPSATVRTVEDALGFRSI
jgi:hypothetical protein